EHADSQRPFSFESLRHEAPGGRTRFAAIEPPPVPPLAPNPSKGGAMPTDYDDVGSDYSLIKPLPWKLYSERFTFLEAVGSVTGLRLIDVACGDGYYTRQLRDAGASTVVGVDLS